ncbi:hypothetical protein G6712_03665 [Polynucleobacter paneuropaeus]|nr:hypothetical protein [Polynucleobacter paneuropaeus]
MKNKNKYSLLITIFLCVVLVGCDTYFRKQLFTCSGLYQQTINYDQQSNLKGQLTLSVTNKKIVLEQFFQDGTYEICKETDTTIDFRSTCNLKTQNEFKTDQDYLDYKFKTPLLTGFFNKLSGYLEYVSYPSGFVNSGKDRISVEFNCKKPTLKK